MGTETRKSNHRIFAYTGHQGGQSTGNRSVWTKEINGSNYSYSTFFLTNPILYLPPKKQQKAKKERKIRQDVTD